MGKSLNAARWRGKVLLVDEDIFRAHRRAWGYRLNRYWVHIVGSAQEAVAAAGQGGFDVVAVHKALEAPLARALRATNFAGTILITEEPAPREGEAAARAEALVDRAKTLPPPPGVAALRLAQQPDTELDVAARIVRADPALAAAVLHVANTTSCAGSSEVTSLDRAVVRLGSARLGKIAARLVLSGLRSGGEFQADLSAARVNSVVAAEIAATLSRMRPGRRTPAQMYVSTLLANTGEHALLLAADLLGGARGGMGMEFVRQLAPRHHEAVGMALLRTWGVPTLIAKLTRHHRAPTAPELPDERRDRDLVVLSEAAAGRAGFSYWDREPDLDGIASLIERLGLSDEELDDAGVRAVEAAQPTIREMR